jgi:hypothetical protein
MDDEKRVIEYANRAHRQRMRIKGNTFREGW